MQVQDGDFELLREIRSIRDNLLELFDCVFNHRGDFDAFLVIFCEAFDFDGMILRMEGEETDSCKTANQYPIRLIGELDMFDDPSDHPDSGEFFLVHDEGIDIDFGHSVFILRRNFGEERDQLVVSVCDTGHQLDGRLSVDHQRREGIREDKSPVQGKSRYTQLLRQEKLKTVMHGISLCVVVVHKPHPFFVNFTLKTGKGKFKMKKNANF